MFRKMGYELTIAAFFILSCIAVILLVGTGGCAHEKHVTQTRNATDRDGDTRDTGTPERGLGLVIAPDSPPYQIAPREVKAVPRKHSPTMIT